MFDLCLQLMLGFAQFYYFYVCMTGMVFGINIFLNFYDAI